ncbi:aminotransferase class V-fold PLP-dependent enzyme [Halanaerobium kushneri]|uniref:cysteine desulfurase n=1 Tax=Halanaerobium kushneri TaxID=56779 RepID=A0A1N6THM6_9FIRM|nr:aminotransferase class V-fold PLP-dependent enzyme [Halanaerobium kushneri]SIQ52910.1 cysteine desulfurase family protein [Halanaerobium kushneri]
MIYLNNAATSCPKPDIVYDKVNDFFRSSAFNTSRSGSGSSNSTSREIFMVREKIADFFTLQDSSKIVFNSGATEALNTVIKGVLKKGDQVITSCLEHNSVLRPLRRLKAERDIDINFISFDKKGEIDYQELENCIQDKTKLIVLSHASNVLGTVNNLVKISEIASRAGVLLLIDAAQTAGVIDINLSDLAVDFMAFAGHKSLFGPPGIGALYVKNHSYLLPLKEGGTGSNSLSTDQPELMPDYLEAGTPNSIGIAGLGAGIDFIKEEGISKIHQQELKLLHRLIEGLNTIPLIKSYGRDDITNRTAVISFNIGDRSSNQIAFELENKYKIEVRAGLHCAPILHKNLGTLGQGMIRVSPGYFNTEAEIDRFLNIIESLI